MHSDPPAGYGEIEFVVAPLCDALVEHGHDVELFCAPESTSAAKVHPLLESPHPEHIERALFEADHVALAVAAIDSAAQSRRPPVVHAVHGPFDQDTTLYHARAGCRFGVRGSASAEPYSSGRADRVVLGDNVRVVALSGVRSRRVATRRTPTTKPSI